MWTIYYGHFPLARCSTHAYLSFLLNGSSFLVVGILGHPFFIVFVFAIA